MGYGLPAAIAAKVAHPGRTVLCFAGDGDFQMNCQELGTAMQAGAQPIVLILNNGTYGTIRAHQERHYPPGCPATDLQNPDSRCWPAPTASTPSGWTGTEDFAAAFDRAMASPTGAVCWILAISAEALTRA